MAKIEHVFVLMLENRSFDHMLAFSGLPGVVHVLDFYHGTQRPMDSAADALTVLRETIELEGPGTIAAFILGLRAGIGIGYRSASRRKSDRTGART